LFFEAPVQLTHHASDPPREVGFVAGALRDTYGRLRPPSIYPKNFTPLGGAFAANRFFQSFGKIRKF
ncbi:MAG: hypothetical protein QXR87_02675, partial [Candidatus Hadarchaeales archaeon]